MKLNLDKRTLQEFFLQHTEKLVFAVFVIVFVALVYQALGRDDYPKTPEQLAQAAQRAEQHIEQTEPSDTAEEMKAPDYTQIVAVSRTPLKVDPYSHDKPWDPPLWQQRRPRGEPPLFAVRELRGEAGMGPFQMKQAAAAAVRPTAGGNRAHSTKQDVQGQRWAVVTGLVPIKKQLAAFKEYFKDAQQPNPETDVPRYYLYRVERAEATGSGDGHSLRWKPLDVIQQYRDALGRWNNTLPDVVAAEYLHERLVFPLGPLLDPEKPGRSGGGYARAGRPGQNESPWGEEAAHPPEIPLLADELAAEATETPDMAEPGPDGLIDDLPFDNFGGAGGRRGAALRRTPGRRPVRPRGPEMLGSEGDAGPEFLLFRFFDFQVEPGKSYRYRVRLILENPNYEVDPRFLEKEELGKIKRIESGWSTPTDVVSVPRDTRMLAVDVAQPRRLGDEPSASVLMIQWVKENGREAYQQFDRITRGQVLNYPGCQFPPDETNGRSRRRDRDADEEDEMLARRAMPAEQTNSFPVDYMSDAVVVDLRGGHRLPGRDRLDSPGEILLLDADGTLVVRNELADAEQYRQRTVEEEPAEPLEFEPGMPMMGEEGLLFAP